MQAHKSDSNIPHEIYIISTVEPKLLMALIAISRFNKTEPNREDLITKDLHFWFNKSLGLSKCATFVRLPLMGYTLSVKDSWIF